MIKLSQTGVGTKTNDWATVRDTDGSGNLPLQAQVTGTATFDIQGRVAKDAPWFTLKAGATADFLESFSWVPFIRLNVTSGTGTVNVWVGEK